jgi:flavin-dependent dehydrogenase
MTDRVEVAVVGGGLAGAAVAMALARAGREVVVIERQPVWRWRACVVFSSPASIIELGRLGLDAATIRRVGRPIPAMRVETPGGTAFRLTYGCDTEEGAGAVGFDRSGLDDALLRLAEGAGAELWRGARVVSVDLPSSGRTRESPSLMIEGGRRIRAQVVVGADGIRSVVARAARVARRARLAPRIGLTYHLDGDDDSSHDARMVVIPGGYCGIAPVPGGRVNVGIVLEDRVRLRQVEANGASTVVESVVAALPPLPDGRLEPWRTGRRAEPVAGAWPLGHRVSRRAGVGWLLVGDAAGFLDPFTGEGIHRALVSARLAAAAVGAYLAGRSDALAAYERAMSGCFSGKDAVSWLVQMFLGRPALFEYAARRLASRPAERQTMSLVMGDLLPARAALNPRFLASLLVP